MPAAPSFVCAYLGAVLRCDMPILEAIFHSWRCVNCRRPGHLVHQTCASCRQLHPCMACNLYYRDCYEDVDDSGCRYLFCRVHALIVQTLGYSHDLLSLSFEELKDRMEEESDNLQFEEREQKERLQDDSQSESDSQSNQSELDDSELEDIKRGLDDINQILQAIEAYEENGGSPNPPVDPVVKCAKCERPVSKDSDCFHWTEWNGVQTNHQIPQWFCCGRDRDGLPTCEKTCKHSFHIFSKETYLCDSCNSK